MLKRPLSITSATALRCPSSTIATLFILFQWTHLFHQPFVLLLLFLNLYYCKICFFVLLTSVCTINYALAKEPINSNHTSPIASNTQIAQNTINNATFMNTSSKTDFFRNAVYNEIIEVYRSEDDNFKTINYNNYSLNLNVKPTKLVANCTDVEFRCELFSLNDTFSNVSFAKSSIRWTFRGSNVSSLTLPGYRITVENPILSILNIDCAQFEIHNGDFMCHYSTLDVDASGQPLLVMNSKNLSLDIYGKLIFFVY